MEGGCGGKVKERKYGLVKNKELFERSEIFKENTSKSCGSISREFATLRLPNENMASGGDK